MFYNSVNPSTAFITLPGLGQRLPSLVDARYRAGPSQEEGGRGVPKLGRGPGATQAAGGIQGLRPGVGGGGLGGFCPPEAVKN